MFAAELFAYIDGCPNAKLTVEHRVDKDVSWFATFSVGDFSCGREGLTSFAAIHHAVEAVKDFREYMEERCSNLK